MTRRDPYHYVAPRHQSRGEGHGYALPSDFRRCYRAESPPPFTQVCFFFGGGYVPPGMSDPSCRECIGWTYLRDAYQEAKQNDRLFGGGDILHFYRTQVGGNRFTERGEGIIKWSAEQSPGW
jgi:hypothetical protein